MYISCPIYKMFYLINYFYFKPGKQNVLFYFFKKNLIIHLDVLYYLGWKI